MSNEGPEKRKEEIRDGSLFEQAFEAWRATQRAAKNFEKLGMLPMTSYRMMPNGTIEASVFGDSGNGYGQMCLFGSFPSRSGSSSSQDHHSQDMEEAEGEQQKKPSPRRRN